MPLRPGGCPCPPATTRSTRWRSPSTTCWIGWSRGGPGSGSSSPTPRTSCAARWRTCGCSSRSPSGWDRRRTGRRSARICSPTPNGWPGWWTTCCCSPVRTNPRCTRSWSTWGRCWARSAARYPTVALDLPDRPLWTLGEPDALARVMANLLDNAVRHARSSVRVTAAGSRDVCLVTVTDDGPGIPAADRDRVFERFTRLDDGRARDAGGAGLGLAIVRELVRRHGGTVVLADPTRSGPTAGPPLAVPLLAPSLALARACGWRSASRAPARRGSLRCGRRCTASLRVSMPARSPARHRLVAGSSAGGSRCRVRPPGCSRRSRRCGRPTPPR